MIGGVCVSEAFPTIGIFPTLTSSAATGTYNAKHPNGYDMGKNNTRCETDCRAGECYQGNYGACSSHYFCGAARPTACSNSIPGIYCNNQPSGDHCDCWLGVSRDGICMAPVDASASATATVGVGIGISLTATHEAELTIGARTATATAKTPAWTNTPTPTPTGTPDGYLQGSSDTDCPKCKAGVCFTEVISGDTQYYCGHEKPDSCSDIYGNKCDGSNASSTSTDLWFGNFEDDRFNGSNATKPICFSRQSYISSFSWSGGKEKVWITRKCGSESDASFPAEWRGLLSNGAICGRLSYTGFCAAACSTSNTPILDNGYYFCPGATPTACSDNQYGLFCGGTSSLDAAYCYTRALNGSVCATPTPTPEPQGSPDGCYLGASSSGYATKCRSGTYFREGSYGNYNYYCGSSKPDSCMSSNPCSGMYCDTYQVSNNIVSIMEMIENGDVCTGFDFESEDASCFSRESSAYSISAFNQFGVIVYKRCGNHGSYLPSSFIPNGAICAIVGYRANWASGISCSLDEELTLCQVGCSSGSGVSTGQFNGKDVYVCSGNMPANCDNTWYGLFCSGTTSVLSSPYACYDRMISPNDVCLSP